MVNATRPSGATICVLKQFPNSIDMELQLRRMLSAGPEIAVQPTAASPTEFVMPLYSPRIRTVAFPDLIGVYQRLWARPSTSISQVTRNGYHKYVHERLTSIASPSAVAGVEQLLTETYTHVMNLPITQGAFVHGDAIVSNAVSTPDGPRLIDFSPRTTPPEVEVDFSKLLFSALGFDLSPRRCKVLSHLLSLIGPNMNRELVRYYLVTHLIRVYSREPPQTLGRVNFFKKVLNNVRYS